MKKVFTLIAAIVLCFNLNAQNPFEEEQVIVTPELLHFFFYACSPHGGQGTITNYTAEDDINRDYPDCSGKVELGRHEPDTHSVDAERDTDTDPHQKVVNTLGRGINSPEEQGKCRSNC